MNSSLPERLQLGRYIKWLTIGIGIKRWIALLFFGAISFSLSLVIFMLKVADLASTILSAEQWSWASILVVAIISIIIMILATLRLSIAIVAPYRRFRDTHVVDLVVEHSKRSRGFRFVAIGGGTGLPVSLRGIKNYTSNITAIVTVADDGGSSGRLRRDLGVPPPGDLRNNIAVLADDDHLLTRLFQYRFSHGELSGHAFGNLFIAALANVLREQGREKNSLAEALTEIQRVLNIRGRVLPSTLEDINLVATIQLSGSNRTLRVKGESQIGEVDGEIIQIELEPADAPAYGDSVRAIEEADIIVLGPGSLYTSILPNLLIAGIKNALRATNAYKIYVCNVATQPVETHNYTVAEHVLALERHIGRGVFQAVIANDHYPQENAGENTQYVMPAPVNHEIHQRYEVRYTDLTDAERPWRHDPQKLATAILSVGHFEQISTIP